MTASDLPPLPSSQGQPMAYSIPPTGGNGLAVASLISSIAGFCLLFVGGILGIVFGVLGLKRSRETGSGNGMSKAGIIVGSISILTSCVMLVGIFGAYAGVKAGAKAIATMSEPPRNAARRFVTDLNQGNIDAALADSSGIARSDLETDSTSLQPLGAYVDMTSSNFNMVNNVVTLSGTATFAKGTKSYVITVTHTADDWKVTSANFP